VSAAVIFESYFVLPDSTVRLLWKSVRAIPARYQIPLIAASKLFL
jgi:hypothetical protein